MDMIIVWALSWWYGAGWKSQIALARERLASNYDYFSIGLLFATLFSPYKQISAGTVNGPIGLKWRAFIDRLMSRIIGAFVRLLFILVGTVWLAVLSILSAVSAVLWLVAPILPFVGFVVMLSGWVPSWR